MIVTLLFFVYNIFVLYLQINALPFYHQNDYDLKGDRVEIVWYDHLRLKDVKANYYWYNRTQKAFNMSAYFLIDGYTTDLVAELQLYKFMSNEYRFFPLTLAVNLCEEYAKNNFNIKNILKNISNMYPCPLKKGFYYAYNVVPDFSLLPPFIPRGRYKATVKFSYNKQPIGEGDGYGEIADKPMKWI